MNLQFSRKPEILLPLLVLLTGLLWVLIIDNIFENGTALKWLFYSNTYRDSACITLGSLVLYFLLKKQRQKDQRYQALFDAIPVPMWIYDRGTLRFLHVNRAAIMHYGFTKEEFLQMTLKDIRPAAEHSRLQEAIRQAGTAGAGNGKWIHHKKNGELLTVMAVGAAVKFKRKAGRLVVINDITAIERAHDKIGRQNRQLREIAFQASHLIRAPLANILGLISLMEANGCETGENRILLQMLRESGNQLDRVIREMVAESSGDGQPTGTIVPYNREGPAMMAG